MPRDTDLQHEKRHSVVNYFRELDGSQEYGVKKYTTSWCIAKTAKRFFLSTRSIERYLYNI